MLKASSYKVALLDSHLQGVVFLASELLILHDIRVRPHACVRRLVPHSERIITCRG